MFHSPLLLLHITTQKGSIHPPPPPSSSFSLPSLHAHKHSHTATEYHLGLLKAKLAKYRSQLLEPSKSAGAGKVRGRYVCELELLERKSLLIRN